MEQLVSSCFDNDDDDDDDDDDDINNTWVRYCLLYTSDAADD